MQDEEIIKMKYELSLKPKLNDELIENDNGESKSKFKKCIKKERLFDK